MARTEGLVACLSCAEASEQKVQSVPSQATTSRCWISEVRLTRSNGEPKVRIKDFLKEQVSGYPFLEEEGEREKTFSPIPISRDIFF